MLVTPTIVPTPLETAGSTTLSAPPAGAWDGADEEVLDEAPQSSTVASEPPAFDDAPPPWDGVTQTALVAGSGEPPADEPEWLVIDAWTADAVREYEARCV
jgi:hypothetical protein